MKDSSDTHERMKALRCCVIIPTYNNDGTLERVVRGTLEHSPDVIVVNDGSTDRTAGILAEIPGISTVTIPVNRGKGNALREGFRHARENGYAYAITLDSDGQHFPEDIPRFLDKIEEVPGALIVGARNMGQDDVPGTSSFGHRFSIFWFRIETGLRIPDVQTGYRMYPLERIDGMEFYTRKFEFEVEVLVRSAWKGIRVESVPVKIYYAPREERVSHFRKFRDFARTSLLNTILVFIGLIWVRPVKVVREVRKKSLREFIRNSLLRSSDSNEKLALSVALGAFFSSLPIWGWQMITAVAVAHLLKLNKMVTLAASNLSIPPFLPVLLFLSYITGGWILGTQEIIRFSSGFSFHSISRNLVQYLVGSVVFSVFLGIAMGLVSYVLLLIFRKKKKSTTQDAS